MTTTKESKSTPSTMTVEELPHDLFMRSCRSWYRFCESAGGAADMPSESLCRIINTASNSYLILANGHRTLAVYQMSGVGDNLRLRRVEKWNEASEIEYCQKKLERVWNGART
jgi:hypothetical protein